MGVDNNATCGSGRDISAGCHPLKSGPDRYRDELGFLWGERMGLKWPSYEGLVPIGLASEAWSGPLLQV